MCKQKRPRGARQAMAFFDDQKLLLSHLRHAFITSDDTGMCELVMINEDLDKEIKSDHSFSKKSLRMAQRYNTLENLPRYAPKSYDIQASPTLSRRPPLKNNANTFEVVDRRKRKSKQIKSIVWQEGNTVFDPLLFPRQEIPPHPKEVEPSLLSLLLTEHNKKSSNPFFEYSKFNGENHGLGSTNTYYVFLPMTSRPTRPIPVTVLHNATVADLIGLTLWKYIEDKRHQVQVQFKPISNYAVMIAEEDGDIDTDLPPLQRDDWVVKFRFKYLAIMETKAGEEAPPAQPRHYAVKVNYEQGGFSTLAVDSLGMEMGEILVKVIRKRRLQIGGYELERRDLPGRPVDLSSTLEDQQTLDFVLVKNTGASRSATIGGGLESDSPDSPLGRRRVQTTVRAELTSHQYKSYHVLMVHKMRSNTDVHLGVSGEGLEVDPVGQAKSLSFLKAQKPTTYEIKKICACEVMEEKSSQKAIFRIIRMGKEGNYKNLDFEASPATAREIVRKINLILEGQMSGAKVGYTEWREQLRGRKGAKMSS